MCFGIWGLGAVLNTSGIYACLHMPEMHARLMIRRIALRPRWQEQCVHAANYIGLLWNKSADIISVPVAGPAGGKPALDCRTLPLPCSCLHQLPLAPAAASASRGWQAA